MDGSIESPCLGAFWCGVAFLAVCATRAALTARLTRFTPTFAWLTWLTYLSWRSLIGVHRAVRTALRRRAFATLTVAATTTPFAATAATALA